jgi:hypothetical protein
MESDGKKFIDYVSFLSQDSQTKDEVAPHGRVIRGSRVQLSEEPVEIRQDEAGSEPKLTVHKNKDVVQSLELHCVCGRVIKIDLEYAETET